MGNYVGKPIKRTEDSRFIQGKGKYVSNLKIPGMLHAAILRSPYAHATILSIDTSEAEAMEGVVAVFTGKDMVADGIGSIPCGFNPPDIHVAPHMALTVDKARHVGDGIAVVIAEDIYTAYDALDLIMVDYDVHEAVIDAKGTTAAGAPQVHAEIPNNTSFHWPLGDRAAIDGSGGGSILR